MSPVPHPHLSPLDYLGEFGGVRLPKIEQTMSDRQLWRGIVHSGVLGDWLGDLLPSILWMFMEKTWQLKKKNLPLVL